MDKRIIMYRTNKKKEGLYMYYVKLNGLIGLINNVVNGKIIEN